MTAAADNGNLVGPVIQAGEIAQAVVEAVRADNPGKEVHVQDRASYVRIEVADECMIRRATLQEKLGRPFLMQELEVSMPSFAGQIENTSDYVKFYLARKR